MTGSVRLNGGVASSASPPRNDGRVGDSITRRQREVQQLKCLQRRVQDYPNRRSKTFDETLKVSAAVYIIYRHRHCEERTK